MNKAEAMNISNARYKILKKKSDELFEVITAKRLELSNMSEADAYYIEHEISNSIRLILNA